MFQDSSYGEEVCAKKLPSCSVDYDKGFQLWNEWLCFETPWLYCRPVCRCSGVPTLERGAVLWNTLSILCSGNSALERGCDLKHSNYDVNCIQGFQLWKVWLCSETSQPSCQLCSGNPAPGKVGFVMKHPIYAVNCIQGFQLWKVWLCSETP